MSFTILYAVLTLLALIVIFGLTYKIKGLKTALITASIAFVIFTLLLVVTIYAIVRAMPN